MKESWLDYLNVPKMVGESEYRQFWDSALENVFQGFWARFFATALLFLAFWVGVRRQNMPQAALFFLLAVILTYGGFLFGFLFGE